MQYIFEPVEKASSGPSGERLPQNAVRISDKGYITVSQNLKKRLSSTERTLDSGLNTYRIKIYVDAINQAMKIEPNPNGFSFFSRNEARPLYSSHGRQLKKLGMYSGIYKLIDSGDDSLVFALEPPF